MKIKVFMLLSMLSVYAQAQVDSQIDMDIKDFLNSAIPKTLPSVYMYDKQMHPLMLHEGKEGLETSVKNTLSTYQASPTVASHSKPLEEMSEILASHEVESTDRLTVVLVKFDKSIGDCAPCKVAEKGLDVIKEQTKQSFRLIEISVGKSSKIN